MTWTLCLLISVLGEPLSDTLSRRPLYSRREACVLQGFAGERFQLGNIPRDITSRSCGPLLRPGYKNLLLDSHSILLVKRLSLGKKCIFSFSKCALNESKVTINTFIILQKISISHKCCLFELSVHQLLVQVFLTHEHCSKSVYCYDF